MVLDLWWKWWNAFSYRSSTGHGLESPKHSSTNKVTAVIATQGDISMAFCWSCTKCCKGVDFSLWPVGSYVHFVPFFSWICVFTKALSLEFVRYWNHPPKIKTPFCDYLLALLASWANLPSASSKSGRAFILNKNDQTYSARRWLSRLGGLVALRSSFGMYLFSWFPVWSQWFQWASSQTQLHSIQHVCDDKTNTVA